MKFIINYGHNIQERILTYVAEDCAFDMKPFVESYDFELIVNQLTLSIVNNIVVQITGFSGFKEWIKFNCQVPKYNRGSLGVEHNLKYGFSYDVNENIKYPVYVNVKTGWICIGGVEKPGNAVEFIKNCIAVIDGDGDLVSLWMKPEGLPYI